MNIAMGDSGELVRALQDRLGIQADGIFGPLTKAAVMKFQSGNNLVPDGVVGPLTYAALSATVPHPPEPTPPASSSKTLGIDIYHGDEVNDFSKLVPGGWRFCISKATEGLTIRDTKFRAHWAACKANGVIRGAYHFFHPGIDAADQAEFFMGEVHAAGGFEKGDIWPVLDWEYASGNVGHGDDAKARVFLEALEKLSGRTPMIYTNAYVPESFSNNSWMGKYPLWVAAYASKPKVPSPWKNYTFWQYTDGARVPGMGNASDANVFQGTVEDLKTLISKG